jgi:hypothetical protein
VRSHVQDKNRFFRVIAARGIERIAAQFNITVHHFKLQFARRIVKALGTAKYQFAKRHAAVKFNTLHRNTSE